MDNFRKNVDPAFRRNNNKNLAQLKGYKEEFDRAKIYLDESKNTLEQQKSLLEKVSSDLESARNDLSEIQAEVDADYLPENAQPRKRIQKRDSLALIVQQQENSFEAQKQAVSKAQETSMDAEKKFFEADRNLSRLAESLEDILEAKAIIEELDKQKNEKVKEVFNKYSDIRTKSMNLSQNEQLRKTMEIEKYKKEQSMKAVEFNKTAKKKLGESMSKTNTMTKNIKNTNEKILDNRIEAVLELKANVDAVKAEVATQADKFVKKQERLKKELDESKESLRAQGLNPYEEFRKKQFEEEAINRENKLKASIAQNISNLEAQFEKEQSFLDKQEDAQRIAKKYEKEHRESLGRHVIEERNRQYIISKTSSHTEVLDPSGKAARIDPSQITDIADYSFGLGKSSRIPKDNMKRITDQIRQELAIEKEDLGEYQRLVNNLTKETNNLSSSDTLLRSQSASKAERDLGNDNQDEHIAEFSHRDLNEFEFLASNLGSIPGADKLSTAINFKHNPNQTKALVNLTTQEEGDNSSHSNFIEASASPKYKPVKLSKFEEDSLERAKNRHQTRLESGIVQIAGGKTFSGDSFASTPSIILFKDFDLGTIYKKVITLTNVSYSFNSFKLLDLEDEFIDFFNISYEKPGRMSAGMSCQIQIVFKPQINQDIFTFLRLLTETGSVEIPIQCLIKRCAPKIIDTSLDFDTMFIGQKRILPIKIVNSQALPTTFHIEEIINSPIETLGLISEDAIQQDLNPSNEPNLPIEPQENNTFNLDMTQVDGEGNIFSQPASGEPDLNARVERIMTATLNKKKEEQSDPFVCYFSSSILHEKETLVQSGVLNGYDSITLNVRCAPLQIGNLERKFVVRFNQVDESLNSVDEQGGLIQKEQIINVRVFCEELPIFVEEELIDLKCVLLDRIYRKKLLIKNRGNISYRITMKVSKRFASFIEVNPTVFFVQSNSSQSVNIKFAPSASMLSKLIYFSFPNDSFYQAALMKIPLEFEIVNQDLPVFFIIRSIVCSSQLEISEKVLDFSNVYVGQKAIRKVKVKNLSMLPQKIAFVRLKKEFQVQPNDGIAILLPLEEIEFDISFSPLSAINYQVDIVILTSFNDKFIIPIKGQGLEPPLILSQTTLHLRSTCPGQKILDYLSIKNPYPYSQTFEVMYPSKEFSWLNISPRVLQLPGGETARLEIDFTPPYDLQDISPRKWHENVLKQLGGELSSPFDEWIEEQSWVTCKGKYGSIQWTIFQEKPEIKNDRIDSEAETERKVDNLTSLESTLNQNQIDDITSSALLSKEDWGIFGQWDIPIFIKCRKKHGNVISTNLSPSLVTSSVDSTSFVSSKVTEIPLFISLQTVVNLPQIECDSREINFGQLALGIRVLKYCKIYNHTPNTIFLEGVGLNSLGPFNLLSPIKPISPHGNTTIIIECLPVLPGLIVENLEILTKNNNEIGGHRILLPLRVQGLLPTLEIQGLLPPPKNAVLQYYQNRQSGIIDFGNVCISEYSITKKFSIRNKSIFPINVNIMRLGKFMDNYSSDSYTEKTNTGLPVISIRPDNLIIYPNKGEEIEVLFRPDYSRPLPFREEFIVMIGDKSSIANNPNTKKKTPKSESGSQIDDQPLNINNDDIVGGPICVGVIGRAWNRQYNIIPDNSYDEMFIQNSFMKATSSTIYDPILNNVYDSKLKLDNSQRYNNFGLLEDFPFTPILTLKFPDPYDENANPNSYLVIDPNAIVGKDAKGKAQEIPDPSKSLRKQTKKLKIISSKSGNSLVNCSNGTFEIIFSQETKACGFFSTNLEKGNLQSKDETIEIYCSQPKPRSLGGVVVGSWKSYEANIILKGGWFSSPDKEEKSFPIKLMAYVSI